MRRFPSFLFLVVLAGCAVGAAQSASAQAPEYRYRQAGSGGPVVVFESGLGDGLETWKSVQYYARNFSEEVTGLVLVDSSHWDQFERMRRADPSSAAASARQASGLSGVRRAEFGSLELTGREVRDSPPLRPMPLIVLSAGRMARGSNVSVEFWHELQRELAAQLPGARHTIAERSEHFIQRQQPQFVWAAVRDIVVALRGQ